VIIEEKIQEIIHTMRGVVILKRAHLEKKIEEADQILESLNSERDGIEVITSVSTLLTSFEQLDEVRSAEITAAENELIRLYRYLVSQHKDLAKEN